MVAYASGVSIEDRAVSAAEAEPGSVEVYDVSRGWEPDTAHVLARVTTYGYSRWVVWDYDDSTGRVGAEWEDGDYGRATAEWRSRGR